MRRQSTGWCSRPSLARMAARDCRISLVVRSGRRHDRRARQGRDLPMGQNFAGLGTVSAVHDCETRR